MRIAYGERLRESVPRVRDRIAAAARAAGRDPAAVRLIAVTKGHPVEAARAALDVGLIDLGENRVEELALKRSVLDPRSAAARVGPRWHLIGHVQSRKSGTAAGLADLVHSVDSLRLAGKLGSAAAADGRTLAVLMQVNTSGEASKTGLGPEEAEDAALAAAEVPGLRVDGLMTMAPFTEDAVVLGRTFARLRELRDRLVARSARVGGELSMGMTNDFDVAIREGSTMIRVGTALFGERT